MLFAGDSLSNRPIPSWFPHPSVHTHTHIQTPTPTFTPPYAQPQERTHSFAHPYSPPFTHTHTQLHICPHPPSCPPCFHTIMHTHKYPCPLRPWGAGGRGGRSAGHMCPVGEESERTPPAQAPGTISSQQPCMALEGRRAPPPCTAWFQAVLGTPAPRP